jgi:hypothetical protein
MRTRCTSLLLLVLLALPGRVPAQENAAANDKKAESKSDIKNKSKHETESAPVLEKENWGVLDDLKTGLLPLSADVIERNEQPDFVRELVHVHWRLVDPIDLWVIRPKVTHSVPVVLYLYSYLDTNDRFRDNGWCKRATADGYAAVGFVSALTDYRFRFRPLKQWFVSQLAESLGSTVHDVQFILNYLGSRGDMDMAQVGMFGMGSGASIAILAAHADPRIKTLDLLDPWGDWPDWLKESPVVRDEERSKYLTPDFLKSVASLDPVDYLPSLKTHSFRLQQTLSEPETPKVAKERIAAALQNPSQLVQYENPQDLLKAWETSGLSGWIKRQMRSQTPPGSSGDGRVALVGKGLTPSDIETQGAMKESDK